MQNYNLPNPNNSSSWRDWASSLISALSKQSGQLEAVPVKLEHRRSNDRASAADAGVLMYDPDANGVVYADGTKWNLLSSGGPTGGGTGTTGPISYSDLIDVPERFEPAPHRHNYLDIDGELPQHRHDASEIDNLPTGSGGTSNSPVTAYQTRALAIAASIPASIRYIAVEGLFFEADAAGTALETAGGRKWSPHLLITPLHWGARGDRIGDDRVQVQAALNFLVKATASKPDAYNLSPRAVFSGMGKQYAVSGPIFIGNVGNGAGMVYHAAIRDLKLVAIAGDWEGEVVSGILKSLLIVAWRMDANYSDQGAGLFNNTFDGVILDCNYLTGGLYLENTNSCSVIKSRIARIGAGRCGYDTGQFRVPAGAPHPYVKGNGALLIDNLIIGGLEEEVQPQFPNALTQDQMDTIGMRHRSNDARINDVIINGVTRAAEFNDCGAVQVSNFHPWSKLVVIGENTNNLMFNNCYFDFTEVRVIGSFNHYFVGCHWILGNNTRGDGLNLVATKALESAEGLILSGCRFRNDIGIRYTTQGVGTWAAANLRLLEISGCKFDTNPPEYVENLNGSLAVKYDGAVEISRKDKSFGRAGVYGNFISLGMGRASAGYTGIEFYAAQSSSTSFRIQQYASGNVNITNDNDEGTISIGNAGTTDALVVKPSGTVATKRLKTYSSVSAAKSGGLVAGDLFRTSTGTLMVVY